jgi:two-component system phosphate regulon response regulator PhoB
VPSAPGRRVPGLPAGTMNLADGPRPHRIVVADDDRDLAETLVMLLDAEGYRTSSAPTGKAALALVAAERPAAVLLDFMLPDMSGGEVGLALRADAAFRDVRIVMYTSTPEETVRAVFDGYDAFLAKPVLHDRLATTLDRVLALRA